MKNKLAEKAGYKDAKAWFSQHLVDLSEAALRMYEAVAEAFSEQVARRFGVTCLSLLLTYEEAADMKANHEEPGPTVIEVLGPNGQVKAKPFSQCSVGRKGRPSACNGGRTVVPRLEQGPLSALPQGSRWAEASWETRGRG